MQIAILGRQPKIGLAELESLYGSERVWPIGDTAAMVDAEKIDHSRLGGTIKVAKPLTELNTTNWRELAAYTARELPKHVCCLGEGKLKLGISTYGINVSVKQLFASGLDFKKVCKQSGRSTRVVPNTELALNSAQVLHNKLAGDPLGMELLYIRNGSKTWLAQTWSVQDVDAYAKRDHGRPMRDARVGMLPPKLAQTIVNLATGREGAKLILDPFCGTGVVLQEAALMGYQIYGTDIEPRMIDYTRANLQVVLGKDTGKFEVGDATSHEWQPSPDAVAAETYLGRPLTALPTPEKLQEIVGDCNTIIEKFLRNIRPQLHKDSRLCLAVPAWSAGSSFKHLPLLDHLESMGYNRVKFKHASRDDLIYRREDQVVARELLVLTVKD
jgi:tRNA G10  N-methylase Trm11